MKWRFAVKNTTTVEYRLCRFLMEDEQCFYFFANVIWFHHQRTILLFSYWFQKTLKLVVFVKVDFQSKSDWNPFVLRSVGKINTQLPYKEKNSKSNFLSQFSTNPVVFCTVDPWEKRSRLNCIKNTTIIDTFFMCNSFAKRFEVLKNQSNQAGILPRQCFVFSDVSAKKKEKCSSIAVFWVRWTSCILF